MQELLAPSAPGGGLSYEASPGPFVDQGSAADQGRLDVRTTRGGARLGDAGGEEAEVVGEGAVGVVGDACAQDGDRLGR
jgi:hypothetical protein